MRLAKALNGQEPGLRPRLRTFCLDHGLIREREELNRKQLAERVDSFLTTRADQFPNALPERVLRAFLRDRPTSKITEYLESDREYLDADEGDEVFSYKLTKLVSSNDDPDINRQRGHFGRLFKAEIQEAGETRSYAVKFVAPDNDPGGQQLANEFAKAHALRHGGIVRYVLHRVDPMLGPFVVTEWVAGHDLRAADQQLRSGLTSRDAAYTRAIREGFARRCLAQAAEALQYCHVQGVVHRDIQPGNIMYAGSARGFVVVDFGLARSNGADYGIPGHRRYCAPECLDSYLATPETDQYSLAATIAALLVGVERFESLSLTDPCTLIPTWVGEDLREALERALSSDPTERHERIADLAAQAPPRE